MKVIHVAFYPSDWLAGTRGLSDAETGVYITLVAQIYENAGPIERDDKRLSRLCGCKSKTAFVNALEYLISTGKIDEVEGRLSNKRATFELKNASEKSSKARQASKQRWSKKSNENNEGGDADALQTHSPSICSGDARGHASQSQSYSITLEPNGSNDGEAVESDEIIDAHKQAVWSRGVPFLTERGVSEKQARTVIGKWIRDHGSTALFEALAEANRSGTEDPIPYITKTLQPEPDVQGLVRDSIKRIS